MATQAFLPFFGYQPTAGTTRQIQSYWNPKRTGSVWEDSVIARAYAEVYLTALHDGALPACTLTDIVAAMGRRDKRGSDVIETIFLNELAKQMAVRK